MLIKNYLPHTKSVNLIKNKYYSYIMVWPYYINKKSFQFSINCIIFYYNKMFLILFVFISIIVCVEYINIIINCIQNI